MGRIGIQETSKIQFSLNCLMLPVRTYQKGDTKSAFYTVEMKILGRRNNPSGMSHPLIPPLIELRCRCGGKIHCEHPSNIKGRYDTLEGYYMHTAEDKSFTAKCEKCSFSKKNLSYFDLTKIGDPFYIASVGQVPIWGWNREHFKMVIAYLDGEDTSNNRWHSYTKYISGKWKSPSRKAAFIKAGKKILNT